MEEPAQIDNRRVLEVKDRVEALAAGQPGVITCQPHEDEAGVRAHHQQEVLDAVVQVSGQEFPRQEGRPLQFTALAAGLAKRRAALRKQHGQ